jgi:glycosyltransferase involved in cell wall biosynthesis
MEQKETISPVRHMKDEFIIPCVIDLPPHSIKATKPRVPNSKITFSFLAEISPRKGLRELVEAFTRWTVQNKLTDKVRLAIGGSARPGSARYLTRTQSIACSHPNVEIEFKGAIPHADRGDFYGCTDIFVAPSRFESFGRTIPEALLEGCTILSAPNLGALEYFPENDCITVAQSATTDDLVAGLDKAYACFINQGSGVRSLTTKFAWETIRNINAQAQAAWLELLSR